MISDQNLSLIKKKRRRPGDFWILILTIAISLFGVLMDYSASYYVALSKMHDPNYYLRDALMWLVLGWIIFTICSFIDYYFYCNIIIAIAAAIGGFGLLCAVFTPLGVSLNNATRWIYVGPISIMPGEIMKTCMIVFFAWFFSSKKDRLQTPFGLMISLGMLAAAFLLIYKQPNLSTALIVAAIIFGMMFFAGLSIRVVVAIVGVGAFGIAALVIMKGGYMLSRITSFVDPFADSLGAGYQVCQGLLAMGSGGLFGVGLGNSIQKAFYLPEPMSDFILAIIGEELGFVAVLLLLIAYLVLIYAIFSVAIRSKDRFGMLFASGVGLHLGLQVILNVAVVTASAPATGVALPLVTLGGNALVLFMAELGIVYNISKSARREGKTAGKKASVLTAMGQ